MEACLWGCSRLTLWWCSVSRPSHDIIQQEVHFGGFWFKNFPFFHQKITISPQFFLNCHILKIRFRKRDILGLAAGVICQRASPHKGGGLGHPLQKPLFESKHRSQGHGVSACEACGPILLVGIEMGGVCCVWFGRFAMARKGIWLLCCPLGLSKVVRTSPKKI